MHLWLVRICGPSRLNTTPAFFCERKEASLRWWKATGKLASGSFKCWISCQYAINQSTRQLHNCSACAELWAAISTAPEAPASTPFIGDSETFKSLHFEGNLLVYCSVFLCYFILLQLSFWNALYLVPAARVGHSFVIVNWAVPSSTPNVSFQK